jgi:hypothetical protein
MQTEKSADQHDSPPVGNHDGVGQDIAIAMVGEQQHSIDPVIAARAIRKIDWFLIPAMIFGCM